MNCDRLPILSFNLHFERLTHIMDSQVFFGIIDYNKKPSIISYCCILVGNMHPLKDGNVMQNFLIFFLLRVVENTYETGYKKHTITPF